METKVLDLILENDFQIKEWTGDHKATLHVSAEARIELAALKSQLAKKVEAETLLLRLVNAEITYRTSHDLRGSGHLATGRAWDEMRRAGDAARKYLKSAGFIELGDAK
jgi:hypothetical protein